MVKCQLHRFGEVDCLPPRGLADLLPATETVGNNQSFWRRFPHGWQQYSLSYRLRHLEFVFFKSQNDPAIPQQPESINCTSTPILLSKELSSSIFMSAL